MTQTGESFGAVVTNVKNSIELLLSGGAGQVDCTRQENPKEATLTITSTEPSRAPIEITLDCEFGAYFTVGRGSIFEIPFGDKRYSQLGFTDSVVALTSAIIKNGFEEKVLVSQGEIVGASGVIKAGGALRRNVRESWRKIRWNPFRRTEWEHHVYLPY